MMGRERLEKNLADQMKEAQLKLGYEEETMRLYYPVASLNLLLGTDCEKAGEMKETLEKLFAEPESRIGKLEFAVRADRIEVSVPPEGARYVHEHMGDVAFLQEIVSLFSDSHGKSVEDVKQVFGKFGAYVCEQMPEGSDFDQVLYFEDPSVDEYYYCVKEEMGHLIYHRFLKEDYRMM